MASEQTKNTTGASVGYAALRHGGCCPERAAVELGLDADRQARLEAFFQRRAGGGAPDERMRPRYAKHGRHVADVLAHGGFPVLPERRR